MSDVTFVITSCGRLDLLDRTIKSFIKANAYDIDSWILTEDSGDIENYKRIVEKYGSFFDRIIFHKGVNKGGIKIIDEAYRTVDTEYIFHCENDWLFHNEHHGKFIEDSKKILEFNEKIITVWLRDWQDLGQHKPHHMRVKGSGVEFNYVFYWGLWGGFTLNPGLRRKSDWDKIGGYKRFHSDIDKPNPWVGAEHKIAEWYSKHGYLGAWLGDFCYHIG